MFFFLFWFVLFISVRFSLFLFLLFVQKIILLSVWYAQRSFFKETRWFAANKILLSTFRRVKNMLALLLWYIFFRLLIQRLVWALHWYSLALTTGRWIQTTLTHTCTRIVIAFTLDAMTTKFYLWQNIYYFLFLNLVEHTKDRKIIIYAEANNMFEFDVFLFLLLFMFVRFDDDVTSVCVIFLRLLWWA